jgi:hypothetical protein
VVRRGDAAQLNPDEADNWRGQEAIVNNELRDTARSPAASFLRVRIDPALAVLSHHRLLWSNMRRTTAGLWLSLAALWCVPDEHWCQLNPGPPGLAQRPHRGPFDARPTSTAKRTAVHTASTPCPRMAVAVCPWLRRCPLAQFGWRWLTVPLGRLSRPVTDTEGDTSSAANTQANEHSTGHNTRLARRPGTDELNWFGCRRV